MRCVFGDPKKAPPPLEKLSPIEAVSLLWKGEGSLVEELLECICPHVDGSILSELKLKIHAHDPSNSKDIEKELHKSLLWSVAQCYSLVYHSLFFLFTILCCFDKALFVFLFEG